MAQTAMAVATKSEQATMPMVMIVDDDPALGRMMTMMLRDGGFDVSTATDGEAGLHKIDDEGAPDAIVLDLEMPVMDGRTFYREIRARGIDSPVLVLSANGARAASRELGAQAHMDKPFDPDTLVRKVRALL
jgi:DNA-binding response OmpR family regulator